MIHGRYLHPVKISQMSGRKVRWVSTIAFAGLP